MLHGCDVHVVKTRLPVETTQWPLGVRSPPLRHPHPAEAMAQLLSAAQQSALGRELSEQPSDGPANDASRMAAAAPNTHDVKIRPVSPLARAVALDSMWRRAPPRGTGMAWQWWAAHAQPQSSENGGPRGGGLLECVHTPLSGQ